MEQTELREKLEAILKKHCLAHENKYVSFPSLIENEWSVEANSIALDAMEDALSLNRSVHTKELKDITDDEIEKEAFKRINALTFERNHLRDVIEIKYQKELMIVERLKELEGKLKVAKGFLETVSTGLIHSITYKRVKEFLETLKTI